MKRICAWCKKPLEDVEGDAEADAPVTHGMCEACAFHLTAQAGMPLRQFLDGLGISAIAVDPVGKILAGSDEAESELGVDFAAAEGRLCGDVFECDHAILPEGCGRTVHCLGCAIRRAIQETNETGRACRRVPAHLSRKLSEDKPDIRYYISTEKAGDIILMRIEEATEEEEKEEK